MRLAIEELVAERIGERGAQHGERRQQRAHAGGGELARAKQHDAEQDQACERDTPQRHAGAEAAQDEGCRQDRRLPGRGHDPARRMRDRVADAEIEQPETDAARQQEPPESPAEQPQHRAQSARAAAQQCPADQ
jgi:hypothetical protein